MGENLFFLCTIVWLVALYINWQYQYLYQLYQKHVGFLRVLLRTTFPDAKVNQE